MPECSICRQSYDGRFTVFVPPHPETFDTVECARRAAKAWGPRGRPLPPVILPTIQRHRPADDVLSVSPPPRRSIAALTVLALAPGPAALAGGAGLMAGGTAASAYLAAHPTSTPVQSVIAAPPTHQRAAPSTHQRAEPRRSVTPAPARAGAALDPAFHPPDPFARPHSAGAHPGAGPAAPRPTVVGERSAPRGADEHASGQLISQPAAARESGKAPAAEPTSKPVSTHEPGPASPKAKPKSPTAGPKPKPAAGVKPAPKTPAGPTSSQGPTADATTSAKGGRDSSNDHRSTQSSPTSTQGGSSTPPPARNDPPPTTTETSPPPEDSNVPDHGNGNDDNSRPGNGWGDTNHDHTGPPGHDDHGHGNDQHGKGR